MADPNFAPFDPADLDPALTPKERVKRGFERLRVEDRTAPGYPGAFLGTGSAFDPAERRFNRIPADEALPPTKISQEAWRAKFASHGKMGKALGEADLDRMYDDKIVEYLKRIMAPKS